MKTPVLLIIFNRIDPLKHVLQRIREAKPEQLYIAADGYRPAIHGEKEVCESVRNYVIENVDWDCTVNTLFRDENLGCGRGVSNAITWFFEHVEEGIILEDDVLPDLSFFKYAEELLEKFRSNSRIMMISGFNNLNQWSHAASYFYAYYGSIWGWATWRRAWEAYDFNIADWESIKSEGVLESILLQDAYYINRRKGLVDRVIAGEIDTWDYQWGIARIKNAGLSVIPANSMVSNMGFGEGATHTVDPESELSNSPSYAMEFPMKHNMDICPDREYDRQFMKKVAGSPPTLPKKRSFLEKVYYKLKSIFR